MENKTRAFRPLFDRVLARRTEVPIRGNGGLYLPETAREKPNEAIVIAVGTGRPMPDGSLIPLTVAEGDRILFGKFAGDEIRIDDVDHIILRESDIMAILHV